MPARQRHYPGRGRLTGTAGTPDAYRLCARPGCGDPRIRHATQGPCAATHWGTATSPGADGSPSFTLCQCPKFLAPASD